ncbi:flagellar protein FlaG [Brevundimonas sp.]|uniref:flagellar protein FlaG n=1 Tax=Brevundimonas sp. TaxID=1871086 RepID=UPI002869FEF9|nr:flagellar protein FlaG [Brevundimonas sp.]
MDTNAKRVGASVSPVVATTSSATSSKDFQKDRAARKAEEVVRYRLIIEEGPNPGTFVYKTLDSATGEVVRQFPREQVLRMVESGGYTAGGLIDTSA